MFCDRMFLVARLTFFLFMEISPTLCREQLRKAVDNLRIFNITHAFNWNSTNWFDKMCKTAQESEAGNDVMINEVNGFHHTASDSSAIKWHSASDWVRKKLLHSFVGLQID